MRRSHINGGLELNIDRRKYFGFLLAWLAWLGLAMPGRAKAQVIGGGGSSGASGVDTHYPNRIINGDMSVDQRNGGNGVPMPATAGAYIIDRWKLQNTNSIPSKGTCGQIAVTGAPGFLFPYALSYYTTTAYPTPAASDLVRYYQYIEGYNFNDANWGTAQAQPVTLEFWASGAIAGTYSVSLLNNASNRSYVSTFTLAASTWTKVKLNIPGDTTGTWSVAGNAASLQVSFPLCVGSTYQTSTLNQWQAGLFIGATGAMNLLASTSNSIAITGVALMVGSAAQNAEPEFRKYADNLIDCQRYYQPLSTFSGGFASATNAYVAAAWGSMRSTPAASLTGTITNGVQDPGLNNYSITAVVLSGNASGGYLALTTSGGTTSHPAVAGPGYTGQIQLDADF
jgi:hypothetical protein